jgi:hypothetical protein
MTLTAIILVLLAACANPVNKLNNEMRADNPSSAAASTPPSDSAETKKEDGSIRAIGANQDGRLLVKPASKAIVTPLGAPSCYGAETDLRWTGDYEAIWEPASAVTSSKVMTFPADFVIVQPTDAPVEMVRFTLDQTDLFAYMPRYTDCHALETYVIGVKDGKAFPITFEMKAGEQWPNIGQHPHHPLQVTDHEFIITGGYGAGQDFINVYHFRYDSKTHLMILQKTEQVKPNDLAS